ncbi:MAG: glutamyl-tRNA reductase [Deltaproteobacteria bacterium]|nr:glutamyl-tRNA reductase [Deltaproteobacteria bacterium]
MELLIAGISHKTAPVTLRERYSYTESEPGGALRSLWEEGGLDEAFLVSTCNRVEVLAVVPTLAEARERLGDWIARAHGEPAGAIGNHLYFYEGEQAVRHLFRVAASLDSMVVGEPQILGQIKAAYRVASDLGATGPLVNRLMQRAFSVAKRVRTETGVAEASVSVSSVAVQLARRIFDNLDDKGVVLLGAGEMIKTAARILRDSGVGRLLVLNRTAERARNLAREVGGEAGSLEDLAARLPEADILLTSLADSPGLVTVAMIRRALERRENRPMFLIDIAVPRNVEAAVNGLDSAYLYNLDDLAGLAEANARGRSEEATRAEAIVQEEAEAFVRWLASLDAIPTISRLSAFGEEIRKHEVEKALSALGPLPEAQRQVVEGLSNAIVRKLLHRPLTRIRRESETGRARNALIWVKDLFNLDDGE